MPTIGSFACSSGALVICDTAPQPELADPAASANGSQCVHVAVEPGRFRVEYVPHEDEPDGIPREVHVVHESLSKLPGRLPRELSVSVEGGRIAVADRGRVVDPDVCKGLVYEAPDSVRRDCGLVITTWGDGTYRLLADGEPARALRIILDDEEDVPGSAGDQPRGLLGWLRKRLRG